MFKDEQNVKFEEIISNIQHCLDMVCAIYCAGQFATQSFAYAYKYSERRRLGEGKKNAQVPGSLRSGSGFVLLRRSAYQRLSYVPGSHRGSLP